ncbi:MAG: uncharacterized protein QOG87_1097 [Actinomycetota bacterium]
MTLFLAGLAVAAGAVAQAVTGLGFSLVSVPVLVVLEGPRDGVRLNLVLSALINVVLLVPQRHQVRTRDAVRLLVPAAIVTPLAAWGARRADTDVLLVVAGVLIVASAVVLIAGVRLRRSSATAAGAISGVMNTVAGIGGPIVALHALHEGWSAEERRATFQLYFLLLNVFGLLALGPRWPSVLLLVALAVGWLVGRAVAPRVPEGVGRAATLAVATAGGLVAVARGLL